MIAMTTTYMERIEQPQVGCFKRVQAARLLEELRQAYQSLAQEDRGAVRNHLSALAGTQAEISCEEF